MTEESPGLLGKKRRILLIVSLFPPDQHVASLRWARLGRVLSERGYEFDIVAGDNARLGVAQSDVSVFECNSLIRVKYPLNPTTLVVMLKKRLGTLQPPAAALRSVDFISPPGSRASNGLRKKLRRLRKFLLTLSVFPSFSAGWGRRAKTAGAALIKKRDIDLVIASHPYVGCLYAGRAIAEEAAIPWIADLRDPWANDHQSLFLRTPILHRVLQRMERRILASAAAVVTINRQLGKLLCVEGGRVTIIPNSFDPAEAPSPKTPGSRLSNIVNIVYTGTLLEKLQYQILIDAFVQNIAEGVTLPVRIHYYGASSALLFSAARRSGLSLDYFEDHGLVSHQDVLKVMSEADLLVLFGWRGQSGECVVTGKIFDYLCSKTPIIAVGAASGTAMSDVFQETGGGKALSSVEDTIRFLKELTADPEAVLAEVRSTRNEEAIQRYWTTYTASQFEMLIEFVLRQKKHSIPE